MKFIYSDRRAKRDARRIKTLRRLLHDIGMSVVQERVHTLAKFPNDPRGKKRKEKNKAKQNKGQKNCVQCDIKVEANELKRVLVFDGLRSKPKLNFSYLY